MARRAPGATGVRRPARRREAARRRPRATRGRIPLGPPPGTPRPASRTAPPAARIPPSEWRGQAATGLCGSVVSGRKPRLPGRVVVCLRRTDRLLAGIPEDAVWRTIWAIAFLVAVQGAQAQSGTARGGAATSRTPPPAPVMPAPVPPVSGRPPVLRVAPGAQPASPTTTPYTLSGQTVCSRGPVDERPVNERSHWFDGTTVGLPGYRCITLQ